MVISTYAQITVKPSQSVMSFTILQTEQSTSENAVVLPFSSLVWQTERA